MKSDDLRRCVNEYTPLDVELSQDEGIGLSSISEEHGEINLFTPNLVIKKLKRKAQSIELFDN
jgi:hypothetical protein